MTLTEQIYQKTNFAFPNLLKNAQQKKLNIEDIHALNEKLITNLPTSRTVDIIIVIYKSKTRHLINWLQIEQFAHIKNRDIFIFLAKYY